MNSRVESVIRRLFSDRGFLEEATKDPDRVLGTFELSTAERKSLARLCRTLAPAGGPSMASRGKTILYWW